MYVCVFIFKQPSINFPFSISGTAPALVRSDAQGARVYIDNVFI